MHLGVFEKAIAANVYLLDELGALDELATSKTVWAGLPGGAGQHHQDDHLAHDHAEDQKGQQHIAEDVRLPTRFDRPNLVREVREPPGDGVQLVSLSVFYGEK